MPVIKTNSLFGFITAVKVNTAYPATTKRNWAGEGGVRQDKKMNLTTWVGWPPGSKTFALAQGVLSRVRLNSGGHGKREMHQNEHQGAADRHGFACAGTHIEMSLEECDTKPDQDVAKAVEYFRCRISHKSFRCHDVAGKGQVPVTCYKPAKDHKPQQDFVDNKRVPDERKHKIRTRISPLVASVMMSGAQLTGFCATKP